MQYKITPGLECLFVEAKAKSKKEKKDKDELVVESAEEIVPTVPVAGTPTSKEEIIKLLDTDINAAAEAYTKLEDDTEKAAIRAAIAQKAAIEKNFDDAVKRFTDAQQTVAEEKQEEQEIANPSDGNTLPDSDSNLGNADQDYEPAGVAPSVGGDINNAESTGTDFSAPVTACVKEQLVVEAEYHLKHGLDKKAYLNTVNTIYNDPTVTKEASVIFDNAVKAKQPATLMKTAEKMDMFLQAAAAYREHKPDYEGYLKTAAESTSGEEWLRKLAGITKQAKNVTGPVKSQKSITGLLKTAAPLNEVPANNKKYPGQNLFTNGKSTQETGNTPEDFPGNKLFDETNTAVETVFPEGHVTPDQIIKDRTIIKDLSKIKDINDQTIAVMQPIKVEPVNLGDSAENNMKDFFFNGNNVVRSPEPSKTLPAGKPAHKVDDVIVSMDELSKKAK